MDYKKVLTHDPSLEYYGWAEWLPVKEREVKLFDHGIIELGKYVKVKWKRVVSGTGVDFGRLSCAYCIEYYNEEDIENRCSGCPIEYFTKGCECIATPYFAFRKASSISHAKEMKQLVDEIFIRSLLLIDWRKYYEVPNLQKQEY